MKVDDFRRLKDQHSKIQNAIAQAEGALKLHKSQLKKDFDCDTLRQAKAKVKEMIEKYDEDKQLYETDLEQFEGKLQELQEKLSD